MLNDAWGHSPAMIDAIYTLLLIIVVSLCTVGFITFGRWVDEKIENIVRWFQMMRVRERTYDDLQRMVNRMNEEQR